MTLTNAGNGARLSRPSILLVDSYRDGADTQAQLLRLHGYNVRIAYDPEQALEAEPADVVILEMRLPRMNGWELVRQMRLRAVGHAVHYIALTTSATDSDLQKSNEAGIELHFLKPIEPDLLTTALGRYSHVELIR